MCCNRSLNHKINRLHQLCLPIIYSDKKSSFDELLDKDEAVLFNIEMFNVLNSKNTQIVNEIFSYQECGLL